MKKYFFITFFMASIIVVAFTQDRVSLSFDVLFPPAKQNEMGLHKLSQPEKEALRKHVESLLLVSLSTSDTYLGASSRHWIKEKIDRGKYILLEDNSLWEIASLDKINTTLWLKLSNITVVKSYDYPGYPYLLINTDDSETAHARPVSKR
jgi:hypothetical protein